MRAAILMLALTCAGAEPDCNGKREVVYTVHMKDGRTVQVCGFGNSWGYPDCLILQDRSGANVTYICRVESFEFGVPTPAPPAENPKQ